MHRYLAPVFTRAHRRCSSTTATRARDVSHRIASKPTQKLTSTTTTTRATSSSAPDDANTTAHVPTIHVPTLVRLCRSIASRGNAIIREVTKGGELGVKDKGGSANVAGEYVADAQTEADRRVEAMAIAELRAFCPTMQLVAEESFENASSIDVERADGRFADCDAAEEEDLMWSPKLQKSIEASRIAVYCDPLDGTNEYAAGEREAITILLGIAVDGVPVAGVIGQPFYKYGASDTLGRVVWGGTGVGVHGLDVAEDAVAPVLPPKGPHVVAVNRNIRENRQEPVLSALRSRVDVIISATGYHYLMLLERRAHSALLLRKASKKWDTCAGEALLRATGGVVTDTVGRRYNYSYNLDALPNLSGMAASLDVDMHGELTGIIRDVIKPLGDYPYDVVDPSIKMGILDGVDAPEGGWKAVTIDVGGCLIECSERVCDVYARIASELGMTHVTPDSAQKYFKEGFAKFRGDEGADAMRYYGDGKSFWRLVVAHVLTAGGQVSSIDDTAVEAMLDKLYEYYEQPSSWSIAHGAVDAIKRLRSCGVKVAVASNWDSRLPKLLDALNLTEHFDSIVVSAIVGAEKPSPQFFAKLLSDIDVPAANVLHVGDDAINDVSGARSAQIGAAVLWSPTPLNTNLRAYDFHELADAVLASNDAHRSHPRFFNVPS